MKKYKRQNKQLTDYRKRLKLILSNKLRLVIRRTNKHIIAQVVEYDKKGDKILVSAHSKQLEKYGWNYAKRNIPTGYLTGLLCGVKIKKKGIKEMIVDKGLQKGSYGGVIYSVVKGVTDVGIKVPHSEKIYPKEERIRGEHIKNNKVTKFTKFNPVNIVDDFEKVKEKIRKENGKKEE